MPGVAVTTSLSGLVSAGRTLNNAVILRFDQRLSAQTCRLGEQYALTHDHPCCTLAKRLLRHQDELFQFVLVPGLPADNNLAERSIRPLVPMRKISGRTRSAQWAKTRLSLSQPAPHLGGRNLNPFSECLAAL